MDLAASQHQWGGNLDMNSIPIEEVKGGGIGELRNNEGTVEVGQLSISTGFGGLMEGGLNVIIVGVTGAMEDGLEISGKEHRGERLKGEGNE